MPELNTIEIDDSYKMKAKASNETTVTEASNLSGLLDGYYIIVADVSVSSIDIEDTKSVFIEISKGITLTLTGSGDLIGDGTSKSGQFSIQGGTVNITTAGSTLFNTNGFIVTTPSTSFICLNTGINGGQCINSPLSVDFTRTIFSSLASKILIDNLAFSFVMRDVLFSSTLLTGSAIEIGPNVPIVSISDYQLAIPAGTNGLDIDSGFTGSAKISGASNVTGAAFNLFDATGLNRQSKYVDVSSSDPFESSDNIVSVVVVDNSTATVISLIDTWTDLNLNASAVVGSNIELWTLTNTTTGECRYDGLMNLHGINDTTISAVSSGGSQKFKFRYVVNGSPLSDGVEIPMELSSETKNLTLRAPLSVVTNDLVRIQVKNVDGTSNLVIEDLSEGGR